MGAKTPQHIADQIVKDYIEFGNKAELSRKYGISGPTVYSIIKKFVAIDKFPRIPVAKQTKILFLHNEGLGIGDIANMADVDKHTVHKILNDAKLIPNETVGRNIKKLQKFSFDEIIDLLEISTDHACSKIGVRKEAIYGYFKENGLPSPVEQIKSRRFNRLSEMWPMDKLKPLLRKSLNHAVVTTGYDDGTLLEYIAKCGETYEPKFISYKNITEEIKIAMIRDYVINDIPKRTISENYNVSSSNLNRIFKENEIQVKSLMRDNAEYLDYQKLARSLTAVMLRHYNIESKPGFHIDHIISIRDGFEMKIPVQIIASFENIQILPTLDNLKKGKASWQTKDELFAKLGIKDVNLGTDQVS